MKQLLGAAGQLFDPGPRLRQELSELGFVLSWPPERTTHAGWGDLGEGILPAWRADGFDIFGVSRPPW